MKGLRPEHGRLQRQLPGVQEEELTGGITLRGTDSEPTANSAGDGVGRQQREVALVQAGRGTGDRAAEPQWSPWPASRTSVDRMAPTSSVMSIPTGHQVMHRPQPTQPELPNWSIQEASLCVIHCR